MTIHSAAGAASNNAPMTSFSQRRKPCRVLPGFNLTLGYTVLYLSLIVLIPLSALLFKTFTLSWEQFWAAVTGPRVLASYRLTFGASFIAALVNVVFGLLVAWVLVRYDFFGKKVVDALVDLPFALPTAVAGISLTALLAGNGWIGSVQDLVDATDPEQLTRAELAAAEGEDRRRRVHGNIDAQKYLGFHESRAAAVNRLDAADIGLQKYGFALHPFSRRSLRDDPNAGGLDVRNALAVRFDQQHPDIHPEHDGEIHRDGLDEVVEGFAFENAQDRVMHAALVVHVGAGCLDNLAARRQHVFLIRLQALNHI